MKSFRIISLILVFIPNLFISQVLPDRNNTDCGLHFDNLSLGKSIDTSSIFIIGEEHENKGNEEIVFNLFKQLYENNSCSRMVNELSWSTNRLLSLYMKSGKEIYLDSILIHYNHGEKYKKLFSDLYALQDSLKRDVSIVGIDVENNYTFAIQEIHTIQKKYCSEREIENLLASLGDFRTLSSSSIKKIIQYISKDLVYNSLLYKNLMGSDFYRYHKIVKSIGVTVKRNKLNYKDLSWREGEMFNNYNEECYDSDGVLLVVGRLHANKLKNQNWIKLKGWDSISARILEKYKDRRPLVANIYYTNIGKPAVEDYHNAMFVKNELYRSELKDLKCRFRVIDMSKVEERFDILVLNNFKR